MKKPSEVDLIIIGQGLAGSAVAMRALGRGIKIRVFDQPSENRSSQIAAGIFNPITGRKMVKTWLAEALFPSLHLFYRQVERLTRTKFFYPMPIYIPFISVEEQNEWMGKSTDWNYENYISSVNLGDVFEGKVRNALGGLEIKQSGYLDTYTYLEAVREYLKERSMFQMDFFDCEKLEIRGDTVRYDNLSARRIVFCQGVQNINNPWFKSLPIIPLKGEFLNVQCDWKKSVILNRGVYLVPGHHPSEWRVGATYNRSDHSGEVTTGAREELVQKLEGLIRIPYTVTGQQWGVRPTTPDRKPIVGAHPIYKSMIIFNGFGTKGVSLAPYFSEVLFRWMENEGTIHKEADVTRFN